MFSLLIFEWGVSPLKFIDKGLKKWLLFLVVWNFNVFNVFEIEFENGYHITKYLKHIVSDNYCYRVKNIKKYTWMVDEIAREPRTEPSNV
jgi:hypothetical protein